MRSGIRQSQLVDIEIGRSGTGVERLNEMADTLGLTTKERCKLIEAAGFRLTPKGS